MRRDVPGLAIRPQIRFITGERGARGRARPRAMEATRRMSEFERETIVALSTAPGRGAIAVVRLSGAKALPVLTGIFRPRKKRSAFPKGRPVLGCFMDDGQAFDEGLALYHQAPDSVTGEDVVEMHCHGGPAIVGTILRLAREMGARPAVEGEFTRRAFLEGKIDLVQAEAVADLVAAQTEKAARAALNHLEGRLSNALEGVWEKIVEAGAHIEAAIDFPDEFEPGAGPSVSGAPMGSAELAGLFAEIEEALERLIESYRSGRILREGARVAILGRPNAGKSTLLNALLGADRAITSEIPGTTRDTVEEVCDFGGAPVRLIDTAGLRDTGDPVELEGTERARKAAGEADLSLMILDITAGDSEVAWAVREARALDCENLFVFNKMDKATLQTQERARAALRESAPDAQEAVFISALTGEGLPKLRGEVARVLMDEGGLSGTESVLTRERHHGQIAKCLEAVRSARAGAEGDISPELVAVHLNEAQTALAELLGRDYGEALLDKIFSTFCIGK